MKSNLKNIDNMQNQLSPQKYITTKARSLPFSECYVNEDWTSKGMATIVLTKQMPSGKFIFASYLVDLYCLGLKDTTSKFNVSATECQELLDQFSSNQMMVNCDVSFIHNLIYGAIDYAEEIGFKPHKDFGLTEYMLDTDLITDGIDEIEFGKNGKPFFIAGPFDNVKRIMAILNQNLGEDNYTFTYSTDNDWEE